MLWLPVRASNARCDDRAVNDTAPSRIRLRQVALVADDLAATERRIVDELGLSLCFRDPAVATFGLHNALFPIGDRLLEVVSPTAPGTTAGRLLERRGGDGGYMAIFETDEELEDLRRRVASADVRVVFEAVGGGVTGLHLHPRDVGGAIVSIDRTDVWGEWPWAGPVWREHVRPGPVDAMVAVEISAPDPDAMCRRWAEVLGRVAGERRIDLDDDTWVQFVTAGDRGAGLDAVILRSVGPMAPVSIAGCEFRSV